MTSDTNDRGLTQQQQIFQIPPVAILFLFPGIVVVVYFLALGYYYVFPGNSNGMSDVYSNFYWYGAMGIFLMIGVLCAAIASRYKRDGKLGGGTCNKTCGPGKLTGRTLAKAPLFGGHIPLKNKWDEVDSCYIIPCSSGILNDVIVSSFAITLPSTFNTNDQSSQSIYYNINDIFKAKNEKVTFTDGCSCVADDAGGGTYDIITTTTYLTAPNAGNAIITKRLETSRSDKVDTKGTTVTIGKSNATVEIFTSSDGNSITKKCSLLVNIDLVYVDTITSILLNKTELLLDPAAGPTSAPIPLTAPSGTTYTPSNPGFKSIPNITMTSGTNVNILEITMKNKDATNLGFLRYCVYDAGDPTLIYMHSNTVSTKATKAA